MAAISLSVSRRPLARSAAVPTALLVIGLLVVAAASLCVIGVMPQDEGELLVYPALIAQGKMPYRDIWMMYPPGTFLLLAGLMKLAIPGLVAERGLSLAARAVYVLLVNRAVIGSWRRMSLIAVSVTGSLLLFDPYPDIRAYPWIVGLPFLFLGLRSMENRPMVAAGWFFAATSIRFEFGMAGLLALGVYTVLPGTSSALRRAAAAATVSLVAALCLFFAALDLISGGNAIREIFYDPIVLISGGRSLPLFPPQFSFIGYPLMVTMVLGPAALIVLGLLRRRSYLVATNLATLSLVHHFLQHASWDYVLWVSAATVCWTLVCLVDLLNDRDHGLGETTRRWARTAIRWIGWSVGGVYTFLLLVFVVYASPLSSTSPLFVGRSADRLVVSSGRAVLTDAPFQARNDREVISYLRRHAALGDTAFIAPEEVRYALWDMTLLYYVLPLQPANRYLEMNPGIETSMPVQREIVHTLGSRTWVILWRQSKLYASTQGEAAGNPFLQRFIRTHYRPVLQNRSYILMRFAHAPSPRIGPRVPNATATP